jgi:RNA polymerase sigma-70 factor (ECF subfamily)
MDDRNFLSQQFEAHHAHLRGVAYRMLGSLSEAEDAVQEAWLRVSRADASGVENLGGWLTTVVARVCLDMLRSRKARREDPLDGEHGERLAMIPGDADPEQEALLADSVGLAMLVVLDRLAPVERLAFVMHDVFGVTFEEIAAIIGRSPAAARQIASRARRRVQGERSAEAQDLAGQRAAVDAFIAALRAGDLGALVALLAPDVVARADAAAVRLGAAPELRGAQAAARQSLRLSRGARLARAALIDGTVGIVVAPRGQLLAALRFTFAGDRIAAFEAIADRESLRKLKIAIPAP